MILTAVWIRFAPAAVWYARAVEWGERVENGAWPCEEGYYIKTEWSWWSLRFTAIYPECNEERK